MNKNLINIAKSMISSFVIQYKITKDGDWWTYCETGSLNKPHVFKTIDEAEKFSQTKYFTVNHFVELRLCKMVVVRAKKGECF